MADEIGKLAMREEGGYCTAYCVLADDDPILIGSILLAAITDNDVRGRAFMEMMRDIVSDIIMETTGVRPVWGDPKPAQGTLL